MKIVHLGTNFYHLPKDTYGAWCEKRNGGRVIQPGDPEEAEADEHWCPKCVEIYEEIKSDYFHFCTLPLPVCTGVGTELIHPIDVWRGA